ncbi:MAG: hypothetical protein Q7K16_03025 [Candidatus Azambacteria bacterium]|nr:hypothetical protein [Candidatus Azambacteria bacterium]
MQYLITGWPKGGEGISSLFAAKDDKDALLVAQKYTEGLQHWQIWKEIAIGNPKEVKLK